MERLLLRLAKKWTAGHDIEAALTEAKACNIKGQKAILNYLGEDYTDEEKISQTIKEYSTLLERLCEDKIKLKGVYLLNPHNLDYQSVMICA